MFIPYRKKHIFNYWQRDKPRLHGSSKMQNDINKYTYYAQNISELCNKKNLKNILDLGCADGDLSYELHKLFNCNVDGIDISKYFLKEFEKKKIGKFYLLEITDNWNEIEEKYDFIFSNVTVQYLSYKDIYILAKNVKKVLEQGCVFAIVGLCDRSKMDRWYLRNANTKNNFIKSLKFIKRGGFSAFISSRLWDDGTMWHDIDKVRTILHKYFDKVTIISEKNNYRVNICCINGKI